MDTLQRQTYRNLIHEKELMRKYLHLVIRRVQEGKTSICIHKILCEEKYIHIILTMNTLSSGMQFFGRLEKEMKSHNILVLNSKKDTAGNCHHASTLTQAKNILIREDIRVIVCCAHTKRFRETIPQLLEECIYDVRLKEKIFNIHIDEAHEYIKMFPEEVRYLNSIDNVYQIIGYTGSYRTCFDETGRDSLYGEITIFNARDAFKMTQSREYFGVKNVIPHIMDDIPKESYLSQANIPDKIPDVIKVRADMTEKSHMSWYADSSPFQLGNEKLFLSFVLCVLRNLTKTFSNDKFSYHFFPAYVRKATHYMVVEQIISIFSNANVIVMNGNGMELFRKHPETGCTYLVGKLKDGYLIKEDKDTSKPRILEPSIQIQTLIEDFSNYPTFISGLHCVGMSVTLSNEIIGNFDTMVLGHEKLNDEQLYQVCRFCFNYERWSAEAKTKIKQTQLFSLTKKAFEICLTYEKEVETIYTDFEGKTVTLRQIQGKEPYKPSDRELNSEAIKSLEPFLLNDILWKRFTVNDPEQEDEMWEKVHQFYLEKIGKTISKQSIPKKDDKGFFGCTTTGHWYVHTEADMDRLRKGKINWSSLFQLTNGQYNYARIFVGYKDIGDPTEYTIYIKFAQLRVCEEVRSILEEMYARKSG